MGAADMRVIRRYKNLLNEGFQSELFSLEASGVVSARGDNPLCGDTLEVRLATEIRSDGRRYVTGGRFEGYGCSLCLACADLLMDQVRGLTVQQAAAYSFDDLVQAWGGLEVARSRMSCATLGIRAVRNALDLLE